MRAAGNQHKLSYMCKIVWESAEVHYNQFVQKELDKQCCPEVEQATIKNVAFHTNLGNKLMNTKTNLRKFGILFPPDNENWGENAQCGGNTMLLG